MSGVGGWQTTLWIDPAQEGEKQAWGESCALPLISAGKSVNSQHFPFSSLPGGMETCRPPPPASPTHPRS